MKEKWSDNAKGFLSTERSPIALLTVTLVLSCIMLAGLTCTFYYAHHRAAQITRAHFKVHELNGTILRLEEVLTMSARMAAATGDPQWERHYNQYEPALDRAIDEAKHLAPDVFRNRSVA